MSKEMNCNIFKLINLLSVEVKELRYHPENVVIFVKLLQFKSTKIIFNIYLVISFKIINRMCMLCKNYVSHLISKIRYFTCSTVISFIQFYLFF